MINTSSVLTFVGNEQPEACRACGVRTNFIVLTTILQMHECPNCAKVYCLEFDEELCEEDQ